MAHIERLLKHLDVPQGPSDTTQLALALTIDAIDAEKPEPESVPLPLSVDLKAILKREPTLAESVCADPESCRVHVTHALWNSRPDMTHCRVWLRFDTALQTYDSPAELRQGVTRCGAHFASVSGIIKSTTQLMSHPYRRLIHCKECKALLPVLADGEREVLCSCGMQYSSDDWDECISGRITIPARCVWLCDIQPAPIGQFSQTVRVILRDDLSTHSALQLGAPVTVVGWAQTLADRPKPDQHVTTADLMLIAFNVTPHTPYHTWLDTTQRPPEPRSLGERALMHATQERKLLGSPIVQWSRFTNPNPTPTQASRSVTQGQQQPLHAMAHALMDACGTYVAPNLALGLFLSAARARCAVSAMQREETRDMLAAKAGISVLVLQDGHDPVPYRLLRGAASLLSPVNTAASGPLQYDELIMPRVDAGQFVDTYTREAVPCLQGSVLTQANAGVMVIDATTTFAAGKSGQGMNLTKDLTTVMAPSNGLVLPRADKNVSGGANHPFVQCPVPVTATLWCAAQLRTRGSSPHDLLYGVVDGFPHNRFALALKADCDDEVAMMCAMCAGTDMDRPADRAQVDCAIRDLRHHMALVAHIPDTLEMNKDAARMLTLYHKSVRSTSLPGFMRPTDVLHCLIACATSCARLHLREQVKANPDCVVAIVLMEETLLNRQFVEYNLSLEKLIYDTPLDEQLSELQAAIWDHLQAYDDSMQTLLLQDSADGPPPGLLP